MTNQLNVRGCGADQRPSRISSQVPPADGAIPARSSPCRNSMRVQQPDRVELERTDKKITGFDVSCR
jgi:hypothetical protein